MAITATRVGCTPQPGCRERPASLQHPPLDHDPLPQGPGMLDGQVVVSPPPPPSATPPSHTAAPSLRPPAATGSTAAAGPGRVERYPGKSTADGPPAPPAHTRPTSRGWSRWAGRVSDMWTSPFSESAQDTATGRGRLPRLRSSASSSVSSSRRHRPAREQLAEQGHARVVGKTGWSVNLAPIEIRAPQRSARRRRTGR